MGISIDIKNLKEVQSGIKQQQANLAKAVRAATSDFRTRAPGWTSQTVTGFYTIKKKDITAAKRGVEKNGSAKVHGVTIDNLRIKYQGRTLTPVHFKMTPKARPARKRYRVSVEVKKGQKKKLPQGVFLASNGHGTQLPFQRKGEKRFPIQSIKTVSIPQMITSESVEEPLHDRINTELDKRLQYHIDRFNKYL